MDKYNKWHSKTIGKIEEKAKAGNILSMFQLYENYFEGKYVKEKNEDAANRYLSEIKKYLKESRFLLKSLELYEFRRFRDVKLDFDEKITVLIGNNGAGKTSIADAIVKSLSWFNNNFIKSNVNGKKIVESDINVNASDYSQLVSQFSVGNTDVELSLVGVSPGFSGSISSSVATAKQIADMYRILASDCSFPIPVFAFYSVERSSVHIPKSASDTYSEEKRRSRFTPLKNSLEAASQLEEFANSYIELFNLAEGEENPEVKKVKQLINSLKELIDTVDDNSNLIKQLEVEQRKLSSLVSKGSFKYGNLLKIVNKAVESLVPDVQGLRVDRSSGKARVLAENFGNTVTLSQLSQGQKCLVALTGDLALRMVEVNSGMDNPLEGVGIVIIDEIELHLHPMWQQEVISGLEKTFPNVQFIITTHSPQVLSTVDKKCIRQIYFDDNSLPEIKTPLFQTKGVTSSSVLARIMDTDSVPENLREAKLAKVFYEYLESDNEVKAKEALEPIKRHFGEDHPVTMECVERLKVHELKKRYLKKG